MPGDFIPGKPYCPEWIQESGRQSPHEQTHSENFSRNENVFVHSSSPKGKYRLTLNGSALCNLRCTFASFLMLYGGRVDSGPNCEECSDAASNRRRRRDIYRQRNHHG
jgi:hypothetical protein